MKFQQHWKSHLDFDFIVRDLNTKSIIERKWLADIVTQKLLQQEKGLAITADMGFGKSSIISNLVCSERTSAWYILRKQILAYHFCRYDVYDSASADVFIRNLAGAIVKQYPELGNSILYDDVASEFLYGSRCLKDPVSCLEVVILNPLRNQWKNKEYLIVIDALDECYTSGRRNSLLELVYKQANKFPRNVKFLFTMRKIKTIYRKLSDFEVLHLNGSDDNNMDDVCRYISQTMSLSIPLTKALVNKASGNFLHVKLYLEYCKKTSDCDFTKIPSSLEQQYQFNFERVFEKEPELFEKLTPVFEVMCTSTFPIGLEKLREIAKLSQRKFRKFERLLGNELGHLFTFSNEFISFVHKSIEEFLTDHSRRFSTFFIHRKNGHRLIADYFLRILSKGKCFTIDVGGIVHHVAMSHDADYETRLLSILHDLNKYDQCHTRWLHQAVIHNNCHTINLLLKLTGLKNVDQTDESRVSALFIAASLGHIKTVQCLLDYGANPNFTVEFSCDDFSIDLPKKQINSSEIKFSMAKPGLDIIYVCKYLHFCGYNILQIASQNGQADVVSFLIRKYKYLAYSKNLMQLNAFQLAAEHGHHSIVKWFLEGNTRFADLHSLHHASGNGHASIVSILLEYGVTDQCIPCNGSTYWIPDLHNRVQQNIKMTSVSILNETIPVKTYLFDDWRLITCETALQAAIVGGHNEVVQTLTKQPVNALNCTTFDGMTPIMTAAKFNRTEIFKFLYSIGASLTSRCRHSLNIPNVLKLSEAELRNLALYQCPNGASVLHIMAKYHFNHDLFQLMHNSEFKSWEATDEQGATPLHYAFCHSNYHFIAKAKILGLNFTVRSLNGSTPYHSAAICKSWTLYGFSQTSRDLRITVPDILDNEKRSILHYALLVPTDQENTTADESVNRALNSIFKVALKFNHNLFQKDIKKENILHYAAISGNTFAFELVETEIGKTEFEKLLKQRNENAKTPLDTIFDSMPELQIPITSVETTPPPGCKRIEDTFLTVCNIKIKTFLSKHEQCIYRVVTYLFTKEVFPKVNLTRLILLSVKKRRLYPILILKSFANKYFTKAFAENDNMISKIVIQSEGTDFLQYILTRDNALKCNQSFSPLHVIVINNRNTHWKSCNEECLHNFLFKYNAGYLDFCFDTNGHNLLHNAAMGGNIVAVKYLLQKGMNILQLSLKRQTALEITIWNSPHMVNGTLPSYYTKLPALNNVDINAEDQTVKGFQTITVKFTYDYGNYVKYDETASFILQTIYKRYKVSLSTTDFCRNGEKQIGLVHIAAAKGLISFLKTAKLYFGVEILNCRDSNNITPYYLSVLYKQTQVTRWMRNFRIDRVHPNSETENVLLYNILTNYIAQTKFDWTCKLQYNSRFSALIRVQFHKCLKFVKGNKYVEIIPNSHCDNKTSTQIIINTIHRIATNVASMKLTYPHVSKICSQRFYKFCSTQISADNLVKSFKKEYSELAYRTLRIALKFGGLKQMFVFHMFQRLTQKHLSIEKIDYSKLLSLDSIFSPQHLYLTKLIVRADLHEEWVLDMMKPFQELNNNFTYAGNILSWVIKKRVGENWEEKFKLVTQRGIAERKEHLNQLEQQLRKQLRQKEKQCEICSMVFLRSFLSWWSDIYTIDDLFYLEFNVQVVMHIFGENSQNIKYHIKNHFKRIAEITAKNEGLKNDMRQFQTSAKRVLFLIQHIHKDRRSTEYMRIIRYISRKAVDMQLW